MARLVRTEARIGRSSGTGVPTLVPRQRSVPRGSADRSSAVSQLVENGNEKEAAEFYSACGLGQIDAVTAMIAAGVDVNAVMINVPGRRSAPIHIAAARGRVDVIRALVACGTCDANGATGDGRNACHFAAGAGHVSCLTVLVRAGCDPMRPDDDGETPGYCAVLHRHEGVLEAIESLAREQAHTSVLGAIQGLSPPKRN